MTNENNDNQVAAPDYATRAAACDYAAKTLTAAANNAPDDACRDLLLSLAEDQEYAAKVYRRTATERVNTAEL